MENGGLLLMVVLIDLMLVLFADNLAMTHDLSLNTLLSKIYSLLPSL